MTALMASVNAAAIQDSSSDIDDILQKLGLSTSKTSALMQDSDGDLDDDGDDETFAKAMADDLLGSVMEDGEDGGDSIMAGMMNGNEDDAMAQFRFFRKIYRRIKRFSRKPWVRRIGRYVKRRYCG